MMFPSELSALERDLREAAKRERSRQIDKDRCSRIFNSKQRMIGVDLPALEQQLIEKKQRLSQMMADEDAYTRKLIRDDAMVNEVDRLMYENKKRIDKEIDEYRRTHQKFELRREFDLNDPKQLKSQLPCRLSDDDPRLTISSMQKFEGEDNHNTKEQRRIQIEQQRSWLLQQIAEGRRFDEEKRVADEIYLKSIRALDERAVALSDLEEKTRREMEKSVYAYNKALAAEKQAERVMAKAREHEDNQMHIFNNLTSDLLTENPDVAKSSLGPDRVASDKFKGMSKCQKDTIKQIQLKQIEEMRAKREREQAEEESWISFQKEVSKEVSKRDQEVSQMQKQVYQKIMDDNYKLMQEQQARNKALTLHYTKSGFGDEFFKSFNTTTR